MTTRYDAVLRHENGPISAKIFHTFLKKKNDIRHARKILDDVQTDIACK